MLTPELLKEILPACKDPDGWSFELDAVLPNFDITTKERVASFLSQVGHESAELNVLQENLNYSSVALLRTFKKYFKDEATAARYARKPQAIASRVYANRMGNGDEASGDGWKYRGRGLIQVTGKSNYASCSQFLYEDNRLLDSPDLLLEKEAALASACWFWEKMNLNDYAGDIMKITKLVNGGLNGIDHRIAIFEKAMEVL